VDPLTEEEEEDSGDEPAQIPITAVRPSCKTKAIGGGGGGGGTIPHHSAANKDSLARHAGYARISFSVPIPKNRPKTTDNGDNDDEKDEDGDDASASTSASTSESSAQKGQHSRSAKK